MSSHAAVQVLKKLPGFQTLFGREKKYKQSNYQPNCLLQAVHRLTYWFVIDLLVVLKDSLYSVFMLLLAFRSICIAKLQTVTGFIYLLFS